MLKKNVFNIYLILIRKIHNAFLVHNLQQQKNLRKLRVANIIIGHLVVLSFIFSYISI